MTVTVRVRVKVRVRDEATIANPLPVPSRCPHNSSVFISLIAGRSMPSASCSTLQCNERAACPSTAVTAPDDITARVLLCVRHVIPTRNIPMHTAITLRPENSEHRKQ